MMTRESSSSLTPLSATLVCRLTTSSVMPCSRCSSTSPTHRITFKPASSAARTRALTVWSVSPKYCLRSEWPMITYSTPISASISAEISPVKAPLFAQWQFSAPTCMLVPSHRESAVSRLVYGTHRTTSQAASFTIGASSVISFFAALRSLFIFQLPATTALRSCLFIFKNILSELKSNVHCILAGQDNICRRFPPERCGGTKTAECRPDQRKRERCTVLRGMARNPSSRSKN